MNKTKMAFCLISVYSISESIGINITMSDDL